MYNIYVYCQQDADIYRTEQITDQIAIDFDAKGNIVGVEILDAVRVSADGEIVECLPTSP